MILKMFFHDFYFCYWWRNIYIFFCFLLHCFLKQNVIHFNVFFKWTKTFTVGSISTNNFSLCFKCYSKKINCLICNFPLLSYILLSFWLLKYKYYCYKLYNASFNIILIFCSLFLTIMMTSTLTFVLLCHLVFVKCACNDARCS